MRRSPTLALAVLAALCGCEELGPDIDPFPIPANRLHGPLRVGLRASADAPVVAVLDTNTPLSVLDRDTDQPRRVRTDLVLLSACTGPNPLAGCINVERARYDAAAVIETHPCETEGAACRIGLEPLDGFECSATAGPETIGYGALIGGDLLAQSALRIDLRDESAPEIRLFPDIAGEPEFYCEAGVAVLSTTLSGGATIEIEGGEVAYAANRIPLNACADFDGTVETQSSGTDLLLLLSTGLGPTVISESAYARYYRSINSFCDRLPDRCGVEPDQLSRPPFYSELPTQCLQLPSGPTVARITSLRRIAITGNSAHERGPCEERRAVQLMHAGGCPSSGDCRRPETDFCCPCDNNELRCEADATVELEPSDSIPVAVLPDAHPLLQGLREELRPGLAEIDGVLGLDAFHDLVMDVDYPGSRVLVECGTPSGPSTACSIYTEVVNKDGGNAAARCR